MRLVDIFFKNIQGQASDIKGNLNVLGHLMLLGVANDLTSGVDGYFEVNGDLVVNARKNYPALFNKLKDLTGAGGDDFLASVIGDDIKLGRKPSYLRSAGSAFGNVVGTQIRFPVGSTSEIADVYYIRAFIYHGVHV